MNLKTIAFASAFAFAASLGASTASASTCIGNCGTSGANGVVSLPPILGATSYDWVSTSDGISGAGGITGVSGTTNGSEFITNDFVAVVGDNLNFFFNYVTSDGSGFADYGFAELLDSVNANVAYLFTARTTPNADTSPGFGLPANASTLTPLTSVIIGGAPVWSPLGGSSGGCFAAGCGYTGWIKSDYTILTSGTYKLRFGAANFADTAFQSGLAYAGLKINDTPIGVIPEPATWAMMLMGFGGLGAVLRRRRSLAVA